MLVATVLTFTMSAEGGLISHFKFNGNAADSAGGSTGATTIHGGASFVAGNVGQAISFDGINDYVSIVAGAGTPVFGTLDSFTISMWVKTAGNASFDRLMAVYATGENDFNSGNFEIGASQPNSNQFGFESGTLFAGNTFGAGNIATSTWRHVAVVVDQSDQLTASNNSTRLYIDGLQVASKTHTLIDAFNDNNRVYFGAGATPINTGDPSRFYQGLMDDVQVYNMALSGSDVSFLFTSPGATVGAVPEPSTLALWSALGLGGVFYGRRRRKAEVGDT
jgi:hypothetical protein